ncbi:hypothetical protein GCM10020216_030660 [Nonomuraea helvata]
MRVTGVLSMGGQVDDLLDPALRMLAPADANAVYRTAMPRASSEQPYGRSISDWLFRMPSVLLADTHWTGLRLRADLGIHPTGRLPRPGYAADVRHARVADDHDARALWSATAFSALR